MTGPNNGIRTITTSRCLCRGFEDAPTDAHGNPIQSFTDAQAQHDAWNAANPAPAATPGTTLNSTPGLEAQGSQARAMQNAG